MGNYMMGYGHQRGVLKAAPLDDMVPFLLNADTILANHGLYLHAGGCSRLLNY